MLPLCAVLSVETESHNPVMSVIQLHAPNEAILHTVSCYGCQFSLSSQDREHLSKDSDNQEKGVTVPGRCTDSFSVDKVHGCNAAISPSLAWYRTQLITCMKGTEWCREGKWRHPLDWQEGVSPAFTPGKPLALDNTPRLQQTLRSPNQPSCTRVKIHRALSTLLMAQGPPLPS